MNKIVLTLQLEKEFTPDNYAGIYRLLKNCQNALIGDNAFVISTQLSTSVIIDQIKPHLVKGEFAFAFTVQPPMNCFAPIHFHEKVAKVLGDETSFSDTAQPAS